MARKKDIETLSEEQKAQQEEIRRQQREQLAADAAAPTQIINTPEAGPKQLNEAVAYADRPKQPSTETWRQDKLAADIAASAPQVNLRPASSPVGMREAVVYGDKSQSAQPSEQPSAQPSTQQSSQPATSLGQQLLERDIAESNRPESLAPAQPIDASNMDPLVATAANAARNEQRSFADYVLGMRQELDQAQREAQQEEKADLNAARWTGLTELASSIANMIGVGQGNAVSQQFTPQSQNWMVKADRDMKANRSRIDNLRQRQREAELKMQQLRSQTEINMAKVKKDAMAQQAMAEYRRAQAALQTAKTETERQKALLDAEQAAMKMELMGAQTSAYYALSGQREAAARAALMNAAARQSAVENQNTNRDSRTQAQNARDLSVAAKNNGGSSSSSSNTKKSGSGLGNYK